jgi:uncharacterized membrane protein YkvA (DUF1232 family)
MPRRIGSWLARPALLRRLIADARVAWRLLREPAVPSTLKALALLPVAYVLLPLDAVPDLIPLVGQADDLGVLLVALEAFLRLCPPGVVAHHREAVARRRPFAPASPEDTVIDAEWRRG